MVLNLSIRAARRADARDIAAIHIASWRHTYRYLLPQGYLNNMRLSELSARWQSRIRPAWTRPRPGNDDDLWLVEESGRVSGFVQIGPSRDGRDVDGFAGEVFMLYIHPTRTGRGLGRRLFSHVLDILARRGYYWCVVWVLEHNWQARGFYSRMGFVADGGRRYDNFAGYAVPVVRYARALNPVRGLAELLAGRSR